MSTTDKKSEEKPYHVLILERLQIAITYLIGGPENNRPEFEVNLLQWLCPILAAGKLAPKDIGGVIDQLKKLLGDFEAGDVGQFMNVVRDSLISVIATLTTHLAAVTLCLQDGDKVFCIRAGMLYGGSQENPREVAGFNSGGPQFLGTTIPLKPTKAENETGEVPYLMATDQVMRVDLVREPGSGKMVPGRAVTITTPYPQDGDIV
ncbi:MAG: hypothetical protein WCT37_01930 [Patescibacteria group bacterium]|jgi:hypothetical protein